MMLTWLMFAAHAAPEAAPDVAPESTEPALEEAPGEPPPSEPPQSEPPQNEAPQSGASPSVLPLAPTGTLRTPPAPEPAPHAEAPAGASGPEPTAAPHDPEPASGEPHEPEAAAVESSGGHEPVEPRPAVRPIGPVPAPQGPPAPESTSPTWVWAQPPANDGDGILDRRVLTLVDQLVPTLGRRGPQALFGLAVLALIALAAAGTARTFRSRLRAVGVLPSLMVGIEIIGRAAAVVVAITAIVALLPVGIVPALTWIAIGAAVAVGWSLRDLLPDVLAWIVLTTEGQLTRGVWVRAGEHHGAIEAFTLRAVSLIDAHGQRISIPNRMLLQAPIQAATDHFPKTHLTLRLPDVDAPLARRVLWEAALLSPWLAPTTTPEMGQEPTDPASWRVSVRLLEGRYEDDFAGSFPERVREVLAAHSVAAS